MFEPERYPQAGTPNADVRLGVITATGGPTRWMDLGETRDHLLARVFWTPDSKQLAIERFTRVQNELDLVLADATNGKARTIIHESDRCWINVSNQFEFLKGTPTRFIWSSERDGFRHLYLYSLDGKQIARLTEGNWEVTSIAGVDEDRKTVYYVSTEGSPLERHLYSVRFDGSGRKRLTTEAGTHAISMSPTKDYYMDTHSSIAEPSRRVLHKNDGAEWAVYRDADRKPLEDYDILPTEFVTVKTADGTSLYARLIKPAHFDPQKKYPAIVMVYGGPGVQTVRNSWAGFELGPGAGTQGLRDLVARQSRLDGARSRI